MTRPLLWITIAYICGIVLGRSFFNEDIILALMIVGGAGLLFLFLFPQYRMTTAALFAFIAFGLIAWHYSLTSFPSWINHWSGEQVMVEGVVTDEPLQLKEEIKYRLAVKKAVLINRKEEIIPQGTLEVRVRLYPSEQRQSFIYGDRLKLTGRLLAPSKLRNPGGFDYREFMRSRNLDGIIFVEQKNIESLGTDEINSILSFVFNLRQRLLEGIDNALPSEHAALFSGILFGQRHHLPKGVEDNFRAAGISHLLVVSGLHIGLVAAAVMGALIILRIRPPYCYLFTIGAVFLYSIITGMRPATLRAFLMIGIGFGGIALGRRSDWPTMVSAAALITLLYQPLLLFSISFQLSYIATISILLLAPAIEKYCPPFIPDIYKKVLSVTIAAQLGIIPLTAYYFQQVSLVALLTNLLIFPFISLIVGIGLVAAVASILFPLVGSFFYLTILPLLTGLLWIAECLGRLPFAYIEVSPPKIWFFIFFYFILFLFGGENMLVGKKFYCLVKDEIKRDKIKRIEPLLLGLLFILLVLLWLGNLVSHQTYLEVTFLDVGQGDAIYIKTPYRQHILIDAGGRPLYSGKIEEVGEQIVVPFLRYKGIKKLDLIMVSHAHEDHYGGVGPVLRHFSVGALVTPPRVEEEAEEYIRLLQIAEKKGIPHQILTKGDTIVFGPELKGRIFNPPSNLYDGTGCDLNNNSLVLHLSFREQEFLFTGDIEDEAVNRMIADEIDIDSSVLKMPHHGAHLEPLPLFLEQVDPQATIITVGNNSFGHPHPATIEALMQHGTILLRTDMHGAVTITTDGYQLNISHMLPNHTSPDITSVTYLP